MNESVLAKLDGLAERFEEVQAMLGDAATIANQEKFTALSREFSQLEHTVSIYSQYREAKAALVDAQDMLNESDSEMRELVKEEVNHAKAQIERLESELQIQLLPKDPDDDCNCFLEIRAGAGGDEAGIFAGDLFRMYSRYAETRGWKLSIVSASDSEQGGYKEVIANVIGTGAYGTLKFESGGHRVQRVPETESQGRIHTSACTVAVLPELPESAAIDINPADLRVDTFRASGAGGQHVNKTDSAIRITHLPSGIVVECQDERSQHKNRAKAMSVLQARLNNIEKERRAAEEASARKSLVGSGDRSERIRTYNFPQGRVTDHRINLTLYKLNEVIAGDLDALLAPIQQEHQADLLAQLADG